MTDRVKQILEAAKLLRSGDVASGMRQIMGATTPALDVFASGTAASPLAALSAAPTPSAGSDGSRAIWNAAGAPAQPVAAAPLQAAGEGFAGFAGLGQPGFSAAGGPFGAPMNASSAWTSAACAGAAHGNAANDFRFAVSSCPDPLSSLREQLMQEAAQQQLLSLYTQQLVEAQQLFEKQQEAAQLALIMEAAEAQAELAKQDEDNGDNDQRNTATRSRKTAICGNWTRGYCKHATACQFTHPEKEFGSAPVKRGPGDLMRHNFKTAVCRSFTAGSCAHGSRCMFAHGPQELRSSGQNLSKDEEEMVVRVAAGGKNGAVGSKAAQEAALALQAGAAGMDVANQMEIAQIMMAAAQSASLQNSFAGALGQGGADLTALLAQLAGTVNQFPAVPQAPFLPVMPGMLAPPLAAPLLPGLAAAVASQPPPPPGLPPMQAPPQQFLHPSGLGATFESEAKRPRIA